MKISIFTDASVRNPICGYAFYIGCRTGKLQKAGKLKYEGRDTGIAELHCVANALFTLKHSKFAPITKVWLYCDRMDVVDNLNGANRGYKNIELRKVIDECHFLMMEICMREGRSIRDMEEMFSVNHIKAHTGNTDILSRINHWCDYNAKLYSGVRKAHPPASKKKPRR